MSKTRAVLMICANLIVTVPVLFRMTIVFGSWQIQWISFRIKWLPFTLKVFSLPDEDSDNLYEERRRLIEDKGGLMMTRLEKLAEGSRGQRAANDAPERS